MMKTTSARISSTIVLSLRADCIVTRQLEASGAQDTAAKEMLAEGPAV